MGKSKFYTEEIMQNEKIVQMIEDNYCQKLIAKVDNSDVNINHLENIFTDDLYFQAMKIVPLLERKVLYLSYIENSKLNDICRKLKLHKNEAISLRNKGIIHFKNNLKTLYKIKGTGKGGNCQ